MKGSILASGLIAAMILACAGQDSSSGAAPVEKTVINQKTVVGGIRGPGGAVYGGYGFVRGPGGVVVRAPVGGIYAGGFRPGVAFVGALPSNRVVIARGPYVAYRPAYYAYSRPALAPYSVRYAGGNPYYFSLYAGYGRPVYLAQGAGTPAMGSGFSGSVRSSSSSGESGLVRPDAPSNSERSPPLSAESGLRITGLKDGGVAKQVDLRVGDVILGVGSTRTQTFEELQAALAAAKDDTEIIFINGENGKVEKLPIRPVEGKIGVGVVTQELN